MDAISRTPPAFVPKRPTVAPIAAELGDVMERGQALEREGRHREARGLYQQALDAGATPSAAGIAQLMRWIARTHIQESSFDAAREHARSALAVSAAATDEAGRGHAENILAIVEWKLSNLDEAQRLYERAHASAHAAGETRLAVMTASNLGVIASVRGDDAEARRNFESALADARLAGLADQAIAALVNLGLLHSHLRRFAEADRALVEAREMATFVGDVAVLVTVELDLAKLRLHQGRHEEARACCDQARALAASTGTTHAAGDTAHVQGLLAHALGDPAGAEAHFLRAEEIAVQRSDMILEGETARELAALYREQGRNRHTLQRLNQAHRLFSQLRARRELADVDRRTAMLEGDFLEVVRKWGESIESKDIYTQGHCV
jgi:tetratricopeptide (TPR) repeat protein